MACPAPVDDLFEVRGSLPVDGDQDVVESLSPELRFNATAVPESCEALDLVALTEDGVVSFEPERRLVWQDGAKKVRFELQDPLLRDRWYALSVDTGVLGCVDTQGRPLQPFYAEFYVP